MSGALRIAVVLAAAAAAAFVASFMLLGVATGHDPVGRLTPQSGLVGPSPPTRIVPPQPVSPTLPREHDQHADD